jgi:hypothetical protein
MLSDIFYHSPFELMLSTKICSVKQIQYLWLHPPLSRVSPKNRNYPLHPQGQQLCADIPQVACHPTSKLSDCASWTSVFRPTGVCGRATQANFYLGF